MESQIKLGRIFGIQIGLHYSWLLIAFLIVLSLAGQFREKNPDWGQGVVWMLALVTGVLFFAAIVVHELAHSLVAQSRGLPVRSITLFALGGVSQIEKDSPDAKTEFWMAIVGPASSALIGIVLLSLASALGWTLFTSAGTPLIAMLVWLGYINVALAVFNMIPGFPMDGGRVLRAIVWWLTGDGNRSTRIAARTGQVVAFCFLFLGIIGFFFGKAGFGGLWIAFIGWFMLDASRASYAQVTIGEMLRGVRAGEVMERHCSVVDGRSNIQSFVDEHLMRTGRRCFIVLENNAVAGLITTHEVKEVPRARWPYTTLSDVMRPLDQLHTVSPDTPLMSALETMATQNINQLPVVSDGRLQGVISREHVLQLVKARSELRAH